MGPGAIYYDDVRADTAMTARATPEAEIFSPFCVAWPDYIRLPGGRGLNLLETEADPIRGSAPAEKGSLCGGTAGLQHRHETLSPGLGRIRIPQSIPFVFLKMTGRKIANKEISAGMR
jgi:hypothetical protein